MNKVSKIICIVLSSILALVLITAIGLGIIGKNITAESINISLKGSKGKLDYTIPKQEKWQKMLEY